MSAFNSAALPPIALAHPPCAPLGRLLDVGQSDVQYKAATRGREKRTSAVRGGVGREVGVCGVQWEVRRGVSRRSLPLLTALLRLLPVVAAAVCAVCE